MKLQSWIIQRTQITVSENHRTNHASSNCVIAKEIETLRQESQALKQIRKSMGSDDFSRKVFDKVFKDDIDRLRTMEDMWRSRTPPEALDYDAITKDAGNISPSVAQQDQQTWILAENFVVFSDRYVTQNFLLETILLISGSLRRLSVRLLQAQEETKDGDAPILTFDKDDVDTLDFVAASANLRSIVFGIETRSKFDIKRKRSLSDVLRIC